MSKISKILEAYNNIDPFRKELMEKLPELIECEIEFFASSTGETNGEIDYEYGGLKNVRTFTEENTGWISIENTDGKWIVDLHWSTDNAAVWGKQEVSNIEEVYDFLVNEMADLDDIEILEVHK
jgi:hypothetical protein